MELSRKVGQLLIVGVPATELTRDVAAQLKRWQPGGIILFARNLQNPEQARKLVSDLKEHLSSDGRLPWICVDQEGGVVVRLTRGVSVFPGNMALAATRNPDYAYAMGRETAREWTCLGVNVNLAPVLDLCYAENPGIGVRSLGQDKERVAELGSALIRGLQDYGMLATAKHFPGKGLARLDSHLALPVIDAGESTLLDVEAYPFRRAIEAGVAFIMTSHAVYRALDPENPATLSRRILHRLLREEMGFQGLVLSDDLEMGAISKMMPPEEAAVSFLKAGGDQVLVCHTPEVQEKVFSRLLRAVEKKEILENEIEEKLKRIQGAKQRWSKSVIARQPKAAEAISMRIAARPCVRRRTDPSFGGGARNDNGNLSLQIARDSITVVKNEARLIPLRLKPTQKLHLLIADFSPLTLVEEAAEEEENLVGIFKSFHSNLTWSAISVEGEMASKKEWLERSKEADLTLILTYNAHLYPKQGEVVREVLGLEKPAVVCAVRNPFDLTLFPQARSAVASFGFRRCSLQALAEVLFGKIAARGKLPVELK